MRLGEREREAERGVMERRGERDWAGDGERVRERPRERLRDAEGDRDGILCARLGVGVVWCARKGWGRSFRLELEALNGSADFLASIGRRNTTIAELPKAVSADHLELSSYDAARGPIRKLYKDNNPRPSTATLKRPNPHR